MRLGQRAQGHSDACRSRIEKELGKSEAGRQRLEREKARLDDAYYRLTRDAVEGATASDLPIPNPRAAEFFCGEARSRSGGLAT